MLLMAFVLLKNQRSDGMLSYVQELKMAGTESYPKTINNKTPTISTKGS